MTRKAPERAGVQMGLNLGEAHPEKHWHSDEWATPWPFVYDLMWKYGVFDLDPAATAANAKARKFYTKAQNGLRQPWFGNVFLNPPFSDITPWLRRARHHAHLGGQVVAIVPVRTDTDWWHDDLWPHADVTFTRGRRRFIGPDGTTIGRPPFATAVAVFSR